MSTSKHSFSLPLLVEFRDYHDLAPFAESLSVLTGRKGARAVKYEEIASFGHDLGADICVARGGYYGLFYTGRKDKHIDALIMKSTPAEE